MKSEVRALEQAVCSLVTKLDLLLTAEFGLCLLNANQGLHMSIPAHLSEHRDDAFVSIVPVGWPKGAFIQARFFWSAGCWKLYEGGQIWTYHLQIPVNALSFRSADNVMGIVLDPTPGIQEEFVTRARERLIESLQEQMTIER